MGNITSYLDSVKGEMPADLTFNAFHSYVQYRYDTPAVSKFKRSLEKDGFADIRFHTGKDDDGNYVYGLSFKKDGDELHMSFIFKYHGRIITATFTDEGGEHACDSAAEAMGLVKTNAPREYSMDKI